MFLLYFVGEGTRTDWQGYHTMYHIAWALILLNIGAQYAIELRNHRESPAVQRSIKRMMIVLFSEAALVFACIPIYNRTGMSLAGIPIVFGMVMTRVLADESRAELIDFTHLSERAMLYVVFTFGEMIITIASYFEGDFTASSVYFSAMCFLVVVGLFLCYEVLYDRIIDRETCTTGITYMIIHIFLIFALNLTTASLEFMRDEAVLLWPKTLMLVGAFVLYFFCLFALQRYAKAELKLCRSFLTPVAGLSALFIALMLLLRENMRVNILISVLYAFAMFLLIFRFSRRDRKCKTE
jgi:low temperature requirement protein LtrA